MAFNSTSKLKVFLSQLNPNERSEFAEKCQTSIGYLNQIMYGNSRCGAALAIKIDKESNGIVSCDDLCPEVDFEYVRNQALTA